MKYLNENQYRAIELLLQGKKNVEIAEELNIHRNTVTNWLKDDAFQAELRKSATRHSQHRLGELISRMYEVAINEGSAAMAKLILQSQGMLSEKHIVEREAPSAINGINYDKIDDEIASFAKRLEDETDIEH
ncbi:phBC6A51 family helix-turn-helix protein [Priestia megaterium]|uniref:phBC6A51 family helix-turn-helix protein n=1 Tax=Priestia megaterium TaxID=1404 RepID=UPI00227E374A|nr:phBC6A51 family helix-turn-helix protein [Priestia megaterium]MCY9026538.1 phBC6A51 family helix-turn-helix protein [Priestia megaterium]